MEEQLETACRLSQTIFDFPAGSEQKIAEPVTHHPGISPDMNWDVEESLTLGQRLADRVTLFGGSWTFLIWFGILLCVWVLVNSLLLPQRVTFDPYPYIFLNLVLSMMSAVQAPVIMMSQNRQDEKDRQAIRHDYEVNLKTEREIQGLHRKLDRLTALHQAEMEQLVRLLEQSTGKDAGRGDVNSISLCENRNSGQPELPNLS